MEKVDKSLRKKYMPLILHVDALTEIVDILSAVCRKVEVQADDYRFDSVAELVGHFKGCQPKSLKIVSYTPYCTLELTKIWAELYMSSSTTESSGLFYKINDVLLRSQRRPNFAYSYYFVVITPNLASFAGDFLPEKVSDSVLLFSVQLALYAWAAWVFFIRLRMHSTIRFESRGDKQGFFVKHADQIKLGVIVAIITTVINIAGQEILKKLWASDEVSSSSESTSQKK